MSGWRRAARRTLALGVLALGASASPAAWAQGADPAAAADLFHEGRDAMSTGSYEVACAKFAESERLDPRVGTLINLALCEESLGRLATARRYWEQATDLARATSDARATYTTERFAAIDPRVPRLTVRLAASAPAGSIARRDDVELGPASLGSALPVDPGRHSVVVVAAHHADSRAAVVELGEGESKEVVVEPGEPLPEPAAVTLAPVATKPTAGRTTGGAWRLVAIASGAAGVVGLGLGAYFGVQAIDREGGSPGVCHGDVCDTQGAAARRSAIQSADASTAAFVAGAALLAAGVVVWIVAPPRKPTGASVGIAPAVLGRGAGAGIVASF